MDGPHRRFLATMATVILLVATATDTVSANDAAATPDPMPDSVAVNAFRSAHPELSEAEAREAVRRQAARKPLLEAWATRYADTFGGSWYDIDAGVWHVAATNEPTLKQLVAEAVNAGIPVSPHLVENSFRALNELATSVNFGRHASLGADAARHAGIDVRRNRVIVSLPAQAYARHRGMATDTRLVVEPATDGPQAIPTACTDRGSCAAPLTGGVVIWRYTPGNYRCSVGFTGRKSDGSRWAITAGHCVFTNEIWGHYGTEIGPVRYRSSPYDDPQDFPSVYDAGLIRMDNPVWRNAEGGYQYHNNVSGHRVNLNYAINFMSSIEVGDVVCANGWHSDEIGTNCGTIDIVSDSGASGRTRVRGYATCEGDSGGSVLFYPYTGERWGYGILSAASEATCPPNAGSNYYFYFEPLPRAQPDWGGVSIEIRY